MQALRRLGLNLFPGKGRFLFLLVSLLLMLMIGPFMSRQRGESWVLNILFSLSFLTGVYAVSDRRRLLVLAALGCGVGMAGRWITYFYASTFLIAATAAAQIVFFLSVAAVLLIHVLENERVTIDKISAALCVYLLLGLTWALMYNLLERFEGGSFLFQGSPLPPVNGSEYSSQEFMRWIYYSFVTLTTLGYGDVVPATSKAQGLATLEAIIGQFYLAVLVARLVGLHIAHAAGRNSAEN